MGDKESINRESPFEKLTSQQKAVLEETWDVVKDQRDMEKVLGILGISEFTLLGYFANRLIIEPERDLFRDAARLVSCLRLLTIYDKENYKKALQVKIHVLDALMGHEWEM